MTYADLEILATRDHDNEQAYTELFLDGKADAAFGELPQSNNQAYLDGYLAHYQADYRANGERNPNFATRTHKNINECFSFGWHDNPDAF